MTRLVVHMFPILFSTWVKVENFSNVKSSPKVFLSVTHTI